VSARIYVNEEPGMELRNEGRLAKLVYFPRHGVRGEVNFLISGARTGGKGRRRGEKLCHLFNVPMSWN
jgi:hypothetical protein